MLLGLLVLFSYVCLLLVLNSMLLLPLALVSILLGLLGLPLQGKVDSLKASASAQWAELKEKERGTFGHSVYKVSCPDCVTGVKVPQS
jgi:hypothetical protein